MAALRRRASSGCSLYFSICRCCSSTVNSGMPTAIMRRTWAGRLMRDFDRFRRPHVDAQHVELARRLPRPRAHPRCTAHIVPATAPRAAHRRSHSRGGPAHRSACVSRSCSASHISPERGEGCSSTSGTPLPSVLRTCSCPNRVGNNRRVSAKGSLECRQSVQSACSSRKRSISGAIASGRSMCSMWPAPAM